MPFFSPLRYPGGKGRLACWMADVMRHNGISGGWYVEPYSGGAGIAMNLLVGEYVNHVVINDIDPAIHAFWKAVLEHTDALIERVMSVPVTIGERERQMAIFRSPERHSVVDVGFAVLFLNRTSRSGILTGGVIGGRSQNGKWKIDARFNREALARRLRLIGNRASRVWLYNLDAIEFLKTESSRFPDKTLVYLDPPYYHKGEDLYRNAYRPVDHARIAQFIRKFDRYWVLTYDNCEEVRHLYNWAPGSSYSLWYSANSRNARHGEELVYWSPSLNIPCKPYSRR